MVAAAATVVFALAVGVLAGISGDEDDGASVLGRQVQRTTTTDLASGTTTTVADDTAVTPLPPVPIDPTTTTAPAASTTTRAPDAPPPPGRSVEKADTTSTFEYRADGGGTMSHNDQSPPRDPFVLRTFGSDANHDGTAELKAEMVNQTGREIGFPGGLVLRFVITRDGQQWRTVELRFPDTQTLPAGGSLEVESATPLQQQYGLYGVSGEVVVEYR